MARGIVYTAMALMLVVAVAAVIARCGETTTTTTAGATTTVGAATTLAGPEIFASACASCHGADGTGNTGPDLTVLSTLTKDRIVDQVTNGGSSMPALGGQLSAEEIDVVADYVLSDIVK